EVQERRDRLGHAGHVVLGERQVSIHAAEDAIEEVDQPRALEYAGDLEAFLEIDPVRGPLVDDEANAYDHVVAYLAPNLLVNQQGERGAVLGRSPELMGSAVGGGREELPDQVPAGHGLEPVEPALFAAARGLAVGFHDPVDVGAIHLLRDAPV